MYMYDKCVGVATKATWKHSVDDLPGWFHELQFIIVSIAVPALTISGRSVLLNEWSPGVVGTFKLKRYVRPAGLRITEKYATTTFPVATTTGAEKSRARPVATALSLWVVNVELVRSVPGAVVWEGGKEGGRGGEREGGWAGKTHVLYMYIVPEAY